MKKVHQVELTSEEREQLLALTQKGVTKARKVRRAHVLLLADKGKTDEEIQDALSASPSMIYRTRQKFAQEGLDAALSEKPRCGGPRKLDAKGEAFLVATACSEAPEGQEHWTMQLLADRLVELKLVETISDETVRLVLKKRGSSRG
jgi:transposase